MSQLSRAKWTMERVWTLSSLRRQLWLLNRGLVNSILSLKLITLDAQRMRTEWKSEVTQEPAVDVLLLTGTLFTIIHTLLGPRRPDRLQHPAAPPSLGPSALLGSWAGKERKNSKMKVFIPLSHCWLGRHICLCPCIGGHRIALWSS